MKTIKQVADELGVNKDKVKYQVGKLPSNLLVKKDNIIYIKNDGIKVIFDILGGKFNQLKSDKLSSDLHTFNNDVIDTFKKQLEEKDKQIESLLEKLDQEQKLHLATIQEKQQLQIELKEKKEEQKSIFKRIFKL